VIQHADQGSAPAAAAQRKNGRKVRQRFGGCSVTDPRLCDLLDASAGLAAQLVATQARWRALTGFSVGYVAQWMKDGGPLGVLTRVVYAVAASSKAFAHVITAHLESVVMEASSGMTRTEVFDRFWEITEELEVQATAKEDSSVNKLRRTKDLAGLESADLLKAGIHQERVSLIRIARARHIDLFGERP